MSGRSALAGGPFRSIAALAVAAATAVAIVGLTIALFFNPAWVSFEQARSDAAAWTGWPEAQVDAVSSSMVAEVWVGPGLFEQQVGGASVFNERERSHMADVRRVMLAFYALVAVGGMTLLVAGIGSRGSRWFWRAVSRGAAGLALGAVVIGAAFAAFFDTAFTLFHEIFFAAGTWTFDPATDRLVQLFPDAFWTETSVAIAIVGLAISIGVWLAGRRLGGPRGGRLVPGAARADGGDAS